MRYMTKKKVIIIDGGPRKQFNTAAMLQKIAEGITSVSEEIDVKTVRLYSLDYKGCMSCMACKLKDRAAKVCKFLDALTPVLEDIADADGLVLGSPNYFSEVTAQMRAFLERLVFPWLSYNDFSATAPKRMPVVMMLAMNATPAQYEGINCWGVMEQVIAGTLGEPEHVNAYNTYQVKNYDRYELAGFPEPMKREYRDQHWEQDLQRAYDAGRRMAKKIMLELKDK